LVIKQVAHGVRGLLSLAEVGRGVVHFLCCLLLLALLLGFTGLGSAHPGRLVDWVVDLDLFLLQVFFDVFLLVSRQWVFNVHDFKNKLNKNEGLFN